MKRQQTPVWLTAARIRAVLESKRVSDKVKDELSGRIRHLHEWCANSTIEDEPAMEVLYFEWGAAGLAVMRKDDPRRYAQHRPVYDEIVRLAQEHEPQEYKVARRCQEIYRAWQVRHPGREYADGAYYFATHVDAVMEHGEGALLDFDSDYFVSFFVRAARDAGPREHHYRELLNLIKQVDAGADLNALYDEGRKAGAARAESRQRAELAQPEPKDKQSAAWRYWKLRQLEAAFDGDDQERYAAAWDYFNELLRGLLAAKSFYHVSNARALLPQLIIARQELDEMDRRAQRSAAGRRAAKPRKRKRAA